MKGYTPPSQQDQLVEGAKDVRRGLMDGAQNSLASRGQVMQFIHHSRCIVAVQSSGGFITEEQWRICQKLFQNNMVFNFLHVPVT
jgi:hypothetical protein